MNKYSPFSVKILEIREEGVISNDGFHTFKPKGANYLSSKNKTSFYSLSSTTIFLPDSQVKSNVELGKIT